MTPVTPPPVDPLDPPWVERLSAMSRVVNSFWGSGDGVVTLSAHAGDLAVLGWPRLARWVDRMPCNGAGHAEAARRWHVLHGLLAERDGDAGWLGDADEVARVRGVTVPDGRAA